LASLKNRGVGAELRSVKIPPPTANVSLRLCLPPARTFQVGKKSSSRPLSWRRL
jgi:hypothetical protein